MGYNNDEFNSYRDNVNDYLHIIPSNLIKIWRTDINGPMAYNNNNSPPNNLIGNGQYLIIIMKKVTELNYMIVEYNVIFRAITHILSLNIMTSVT